MKTSEKLQLSVVINIALLIFVVVLIISNGYNMSQLVKLQQEVLCHE